VFCLSTVCPIVLGLPAVRALLRGKRLPLVIALFAMIGLSGCGDEASKWEYAKGLNLYEAGNLKAAAEHVERAVKNCPDNLRMKLGFSEILSQLGDARSIDYCDEVLALMPNNEAALFQKSLCLQQFGQFDAALDTYKKVLSRRLNRTIQERNNLAYYRALAKRELMLAATDIEKAIDEEEQKRWPSGIYLPLTVKSNMANAIVSRRLGRQKRPLRKLTQQIGDLEKDYGRIRNLMSLTVFAQIQTEFPLSAKTEKETHLIRNNQDLLRGCLASLLTVRALLFQDLEKFDCSNADRLRVRELGYDSDELASQLPGEQDCLNALEIAMTYLDTRGYILGLLPWDDAGFESDGIARTDPRFRVSSYQEAIEDLDYAVEAAMTLRLGWNSQLANLPENPVELVEQNKKRVMRTEAVILYHRLLVHERASNVQASEKDQKRIETMGFQPGPHLF
jgi:tetratricopeptide (TPR) repeat protein